jgi:4-amino-4-deoxy-L-arabinose transferase-like glycosyltransferase
MALDPNDGPSEAPLPSSRSELIAPLLVTALFAAIHVWWLSRDTTALYWDMGRHGANVLRSFDLLTLSHLPLSSKLSAFSEGPDPYYPPLYYWLGTIPFAIFGRSADSIALTGLFFAAIMNLATFGIARRMTGMREAVLASIVASTLPILFDFTHQVMLDFPLTAMVAATLWLLYERPFESSGRALLLGLVVGLGLLTKWTYPVFVALPIALSLAQSAVATDPSSDRRRIRWRSLGAALLALAAAAACALPWFLFHRRHLSSVREAQSHVPGLSGQDWSALGSRLAEHFETLLQSQMDLPSLAILTVALTAVLASKEWREKAAPLLLCLASSTLAWGVLGKHQDPRYSMPQLAAVAPLIAVAPAATDRWFRGRYRGGRQAVVLGWCAFSLVNMALAPSLFRGPRWQGLRLAPQFAHHSGPPKNEPSEEPVRSAMREIAGSGRPPVARFVEVTTDEGGIDSWTVAFYAALYRVQLSPWNPSFTLTPSVHGPPQSATEAAGRWYPLSPGDARGVFVTQAWQPWERPERERLGWTQSRSVALVAEGPYGAVEVQVSGDAALVVVDGGREVAGALLSSTRTAHFVVRRGADTRVELWSKDANDSIRSETASFEALEAADIGLELDLENPLSLRFLGTNRFAYEPGRDPRVLLYGPYLALPPGEYRASLQWSPRSPFSSGQRLELAPALGRRATSRPASVCGSAALVPGIEAVLDAPFAVSRISRRSELIVRADGLSPGQVELHGMTLWMKGLRTADALLTYNGDRNLHRSLLRVGGSGGVSREMEVSDRPGRGALISPQPPP